LIGSIGFLFNLSTQFDARLQLAPANPEPTAIVFIESQFML
jgi:hypothetical protein